MQRRIIARWTFGSLALCLPALWLCKVAGTRFSHSVLVDLEMLFTIGACVGLLSWIVVVLAWKKPAREEMAERVAAGEIDPTKMSPPDRAAFCAAYGSLPRWFYLPFLAVGVLLTVLAALGIVGIVIWMIVS